MSDQLPSSLLYLYQSNQLEILFDSLCDVIATPLDDPLKPEVIVVQNPGMARWLAQQIAQHTGIAANLSFPLPATFFWNIFQTTLGELPDLSSFDRKILLWRIMDELDELLTTSSMDSIAGYLADDPEGCKKFQLAEKITDSFDQYLVYRPKMVLDWEQGTDNHWQAVLWRKICGRTALHRATLLKQFLTTAASGNLQTATLPQRISFFGINALAPAYLQILQQLGNVSQVHIFHLSPCEQSWEDIFPERLLAIKRKIWREQNIDDLSVYFTSGNPLLASMGAMGQEFFSLLMELAPQDHQLYASPDSSTLLGAVQADILKLRNRTTAPGPMFKQDRSLHFHCCHSKMREVQVLHDRLLDLFKADPELTPADILVMAPDIAEYAPLVNGVFGAADESLRISWSIADRQPRADQPVIEGFLALLEVLSGRFTAPEIMAFFDNPAILHTFSLQEDDLPAMRSFIRKAGIRWGLDARQRQDNGLEDSALHTWIYGLDRLLMGYVTGPLDTPCLDILPCSSGHTASTSWLGSLADFLYKLQRLNTRCQRASSPNKWAKILADMVADFLDSSGSTDEQDALMLLREKISGFAEHCALAGFTDKLGLAVVRHHFSTLLAEPAGGHAFLAGKITFCNMVPMRSIPFKVIWLLGMNDSAYPRSQRPPAFDLIAQNPQLGDRSRRDDDRYLFLESLLSARSHFAVSWIGRDQQSNQPLPPSVVVAELRDYLDRGWQQEQDTATTSELLTTEHPLQPFSPRNFSGHTATRSYAKLWLPKPCDAKQTAFINTSLPQVPEYKQLSLNQLLRFWNHPVKFFLENRLEMNIRLEDEHLPESEPFALDPLQSYLVNQEILPRLIDENELAPTFTRLKAEGEFPVAGPGKIIRHQLISQADDLLGRIQNLITSPCKPVPFELEIEDTLITGELGSLYSTGFISYRPGNCKGRDLLRLWIHHLILNLVCPEGSNLCSFHAGKDKTLCFTRVEQPRQHLATLLQYFSKGMEQPLHFYPETSYAWANAKEDERMKKARSCWFSRYNYWGNGEEHDLAYTLGLRGQDPLDELFQKQASLFFPLFEAMEDDCADI